MAVIRKKLDLTHFPFDDQDLDINIASAVYMANEVKLLPSLSPSGISNDFCTGEIYKAVTYHTGEYEDTDAGLTKSRGFLRIELARNSSKFLQTFLVPAGLTLVCCLAVFWLPHTPMFIMPRLALSVLMLLIFRNFALAGGDELPMGAPYTWFDLLCMNIQLMMGLIVCWNIFIETCSHGFNCSTTGKAVNEEMKAVMPMLSIITFGIVFAGAGPGSALNLASCALIVTFTTILSNVVYIGCVSSTLAAERTHNQFLGKRQAGLPGSRTEAG